MGLQKTLEEVGSSFHGTEQKRPTKRELIAGKNQTLKVPNGWRKDWVLKDGGGECEEKENRAVILQKTKKKKGELLFKAKKEGEEEPDINRSGTASFGFNPPAR